MSEDDQRERPRDPRKWANVQDAAFSEEEKKKKNSAYGDAAMSS